MCVVHATVEHRHAHALAGDTGLLHDVGADLLHGLLEVTLVDRREVDALDLGIGAERGQVTHVHVQDQRVQRGLDAARLGRGPLEPQRAAGDTVLLRADPGLLRMLRGPAHPTGMADRERFRPQARDHPHGTGRGPLQALGHTRAEGRAGG